jgi:hypothetical protein
VRNWADYDLDQSFDDVTAGGYVQGAAALIQVLEALSATPAVLARVVDAVKVYERDVLGQVTW